MVTYFDTTKVVAIMDNARSVARSFKRSDVRIRRILSSKHGKRRSERTRQFLNLVSKKVVKDAETHGQPVVFEDITGIHKLYRKGDGQGRSVRARMNSWPFHESGGKSSTKAAWEGVPVITLTNGETRGTAMNCPRCGERLQVPIQGDVDHHRQLWCDVCERWRDWDLIAVLNISRKGRLRFDRSSKEGEAREAVKGNAENEVEPLILRVDASKMHQ